MLPEKPEKEEKSLSSTATRTDIIELKAEIAQMAKKQEESESVVEKLGAENVDLSDKIKQIRKKLEKSQVRLKKSIHINNSLKRKLRGGKSAQNQASP